MRPPSVRIQEYELEDLYAALEIFERIADGRLMESVRVDRLARDMFDWDSWARHLDTLTERMGERRDGDSEQRG